MLIGSEGILGVITEAWMRVQDAPRFKESAAVLFDSFERGAQAVRALSQSGLHPSNCRLLDPGEAALTGAAPDGQARCWCWASSRPTTSSARGWRALSSCARDHGGAASASEARRVRGRLARRLPAGALPARHADRGGHPRRDVRDRDHLGPLRRALVDGVREGAREALGGEGVVTCRLTHVYPDGAAPYFTVLAPARRGDELEQWDGAQGRRPPRRSSAAGGTITHHHAVGRDHRPWYDRQRPEPFAAALRAAKSAVDPAGHPQSRAC